MVHECMLRPLRRSRGGEQTSTWNITSGRGGILNPTLLKLRDKRHP